MNQISMKGLDSLHPFRQKIKVFLVEFIEEENWKKIENALGRGKLCPNYYSFRDFIFFYENKTAKKIGQGNLCQDFHKFSDF